MRNEAGIPSWETLSAPSAGPTARARLNVIELSATADGISAAGTSCVTSACCAGAENALIAPNPSANRITTSVGASPTHASAAIATPSPTATLCVTSSSRLRS